MATLSEEIVAYESMQRSLELDHFGKLVVIHNKELSGVFDSFEDAAEDAVERFGSGPIPYSRGGGFFSHPSSLCTISSSV